MRTESEFRTHKEKSVASCCKSWVVLSKFGLLGYEYLVSPHLCKSNYCSTCRKRNLLARRKQLYEALKGERWRLITLTFKEHSNDKTEQFVNAHSMLKKLVQRLRRKYADFKYARVFEVHRSGFPHVHFIINTYIPLAYLREAWQALGGGIVEIREARCSKCGGSLPCLEHQQKKYCSSKSAARYLTDELEKKRQDPFALGVVFFMAQVRSIMTSRNLPLKKLPSSGEWMYLRGAPTLADAMYEYEKLVYDYEFNCGVKPSIDFGKNKIMIGYGYRETPEVHYKFGKQDVGF